MDHRLKETANTLAECFSESEIRSIEHAQALYRSLATNLWQEKERQIALSAAEAGEVVAHLRNRARCPHEEGSEYRGGEGRVDAWVQARLEQRGFSLLRQETLFG